MQRIIKHFSAIYLFNFFVISRTMTSQGRSENSDQSRPLHPMLPNADLCDRGNGTQQFRGLVMSKILCRRTQRPRRSKFEFSFVGNDRRPSQKSGTRRENRNAPDSPDLPPFIPDDFQFSLVGKIWDGRETVKSQTPSGIFPTYENQALTILLLAI